MLKSNGDMVEVEVEIGGQDMSFFADRETQKAFTRYEQVADAKALVTLGFPPVVIRDVTGWPECFVRRLHDGSGIRSTGGKKRSNLSDFVREPIYHAAISQFVMAIEQQMAFWGDKWLSARVLLRAYQYAQTTMPEAMEHLPLTGIYSVAKSVVAGTSKSQVCKQCRSNYAHFPLESCLTGTVVFDCPTCRLIQMMLPTAKQGEVVAAPTSFVDLKLRSPFPRFVSRGADSGEVRAVISLAYGAVTQKAG